MSKDTCLFCDNKPGSREHLIADWILKKVPSKSMITGFIGRHEQVECRELIVKSVCGDCNGGWMSDIESLNMPIMGPLIDDQSAFLD